MKLLRIIEITSKYKGKSKFEFWNKLDCYDQIEASLEICPVGSNRGRLYATNIKLKNTTNNTSFEASITELDKYLSKIEYIEL